MKKTYISPKAWVFDVSAHTLMATSLTGAPSGTVTINGGAVVEDDFTDAARDNNSSSLWDGAW